GAAGVVGQPPERQRHGVDPAGAVRGGPRPPPGVVPGVLAGPPPGDQRPVPALPGGHRVRAAGGTPGPGAVSGPLAGGPSAGWAGGGKGRGWWTCRWWTRSITAAGRG